jgi:hypothetical protein
LYAFKTAGNRGQYDLVDEFDIETYFNSLPLHHDPINDVQQFKDFHAWYLTPSNLKNGLARNKDNIADVQAIVFDLDRIVEIEEYIANIFELAKTGLEFATWQTPSSIGNGKHENAMRLFIPLDKPIEPLLLPQAVDELTIAMITNANFNVLDYGGDITTTKTIGRLNGLPLQRYLTIINPGSWRYRITSKYEPPKPKKKYVRRTNMKTPPEEFVKMYMKKHDIPELILGVNVHNVLQQLIGALEKAGFAEDEAMEGLEFLADTTEHGMADIEKEVATSNAFKGG